jgi:HAD superfamily hydrolase (TIGR01509 family)
MFPVRLVIFDMDGLMFDTERIAVDAWQRAGELLGYEISPTLVIETIGLNRQDTQAVLLSHLGSAFPYQEARRLRIQYAEDVIALNGVPIKDGLHSLLDFLDGAGIRKAVATSTERTRALKLLGLAGVRDRFDVVVRGDEVPRGKPNPDIFLAAAARLHCDPSNCMVLEDSESGLKAAYLAGMLPVLVPDLKMPSTQTETLAFRTFRSLVEVMHFLESANPELPQ